MKDNKNDELKDLIQIVSNKIIKAIPYLTILSGVIIWGYLNSIGRLDLLMDVYSINIGLVSLLISSLTLSIAISIIFTLPSAILILHYSLLPDISKKSIFIPFFSWGLSVLFLLFIFIPSIPYANEIVSPTPLGISFTISALSFSALLSISLFNGELKIKGTSNKLKRIGKIMLGTFTITLATLSISIPTSVLLKNSTGEKITSLIIALVFMIAFAFLSFLPATIYYNDMKNKHSNDEIISITPIVKKLSAAVIITIIIISILFPNVSTILINSSLYSIGIIDNKNHYFMINGDKYQPEMFPKNIWMTSTIDNIDNNFFIYGIRFFSAGSNNLICPNSIGKLKKNMDAIDYDLFTSSNKDDKEKKLKKMTNICVILAADDAKQWDTFFEK